MDHRCPKCRKLGQWRHGVYFDHEKRCRDCNLSWEPDKVVKVPIKHVLSTGPHVRGCWALELILGKS